MRRLTNRTICAGDFNLRMPGGPLSRKLHSVLEGAGLRLVSGGDHDALRDERGLIDHIAVSATMQSGKLQVWARRHAWYRNGESELSDHAGCSIDVF